MIRDANQFDKKDIIDMCIEFRDSADFDEIYASTNTENVNRLLDHIFAGAGRIFYKPQKGFLMCFISPSIWDHEILVLNELAWYVKPKYRKTTLGYRLFKSYLDYGNQLKKDGRIKYFTMTKLDVSPDFDYKRYGFRAKDINWIQ